VAAVATLTPDRARLGRGLAEGNVAEAMASIDQTQLRAALRDALLPIVRKVIAGRGQAVLNDLFLLRKADTTGPAASGAGPVTVTAGLAFDLDNPYAITAAQTIVGDLVVGIDEPTVDALRQIIAYCIQNGIPPARSATMIGAVVGLDPRRAAALQRYEAGLAGLPSSNIADLVAAQGDKLLRDRGYLIARTETIAAGVTGTQAAWNQAINGGMLDATRFGQTWIAASDDRTCFPAGTPVTVPGGITAIDRLRIGDIVTTPSGPRRVTAVMSRSYTGRLIALRTSAGVVTATANHPFWTPSGWRTAGTLRRGDCLETVYQKLVEVASLVHLIFPETDHAVAKREQRAIPSLVPLHRAGMPVLTIDLDDRQQRHEEVDGPTPHADLLLEGYAESGERQAHLALDTSLALAASVAGDGAVPPRDARPATEPAPTGHAASHHGRSSVLLRAEPAVGAASTEPYPAPLARGVQSGAGSTPLRTDGVAVSDHSGHGELRRADGAHLGYHFRGVSDEIAPPRAEPARLWTHERFAAMLADARVSQGATPLIVGGELRVYDITVEGAHVFYAGGVLVHNCDICAELDGEIVPFGEQFSGDGGDGPPAHTACRCDVGVAELPTDTTGSDVPSAAEADPALAEEMFA
jgi:hypothetical protein